MARANPNESNMLVLNTPYLMPSDLAIAPQTKLTIMRQEMNQITYTP